MSHGFFTGPKYDVSFDDPMANSSMFVLPRMTAPAALKRSMTVASYGLTKLPRIFEPHVVNQPLLQKMSFWASGMPVKGLALPAACMSSADRAWARLFSVSTVM